ncbi:MAG: class I SAM-dependent methyltransferase [Actinomycetota bacterium]|nr:class I SAM-dependent methyltransferase [Actinomycetota bacterium]
MSGTSEDPRLGQAEALADQVPGSNFSARLYDPILWLGEKTGLSRWRGRLIATARGRVMELGAGTGLNLPHYPDGIDELVLVEPDRHKTGLLSDKARRSRPGARVVRAPAEFLPFDDDRFDTVVATLVFCTVSDPEASAREIRRILAPGGRLLFLEHVRSDGPRMGPLQDRLEKPWMKLADGCHCNRRTVPMLRESGFDVEVAARADQFPMPPVARPIVSGTAIPQQTAGVR